MWHKVRLSPSLTHTQLSQTEPKLGLWYFSLETGQVIYHFKVIILIDFSQTESNTVIKLDFNQFVSSKG